MPHLSKATGFLLVLVVYSIVAGLLALSKRFGPALKLVPGFVVCSAVFVLLPRWIGEYVLDGGTPGRPAFREYIEMIFGWLGWNMTRNWLGQFAWFEVDFPAAIYVVFNVLLGGALLLSSAYLARAIAKRKFDLDLKLFSFLFLSLLGVLLGAFAYQYAVSSKFGIFIQGRHILYALPLVYLCVGMILSSTVRQAKRRMVILGSYFAATGFLACLICLSVFALGMIIRRFFWDSGISAEEMIHRAMQYKPVLMKSDVAFAGLIARYVVGHLGFVAYFAWFGRDWLRQMKRSPAT